MRRTLAAFTLAPCLLLAGPARAEDSILKQPGQHPDGLVELEVHGGFGYAAGPFARYSYAALGPGVRANFRILKTGFIPSINDSIAVGVGADLLFDFNNSVRFVTPVVLQWNFWLTQHWSVFGEPGFAVVFPMSTPNGTEPIYFEPSLSVGGRYNFNDHITLVLRLGYPVSTFGVSFFL